MAASGHMCRAKGFWRGQAIVLVKCPRNVPISLVGQMKVIRGNCQGLGARIWEIDGGLGRPLLALGIGRECFGLKGLLKYLGMIVNNRDAGLGALDASLNFLLGIKFKEALKKGRKYISKRIIK